MKSPGAARTPCAYQIGPRYRISGASSAAMLARAQKMAIDEVDVRGEAEFLRSIWRIGHRAPNPCSTLAADRFPVLLLQTASQVLLLQTASRVLLLQTASRVLLLQTASRYSCCRPLPGYSCCRPLPGYSCCRPLPGYSCCRPLPVGRVSIGEPSQPATAWTDCSTRWSSPWWQPSTAEAVPGAKSFDRRRHCRTFAP
jgi:hypothetical protein